MADNDVVLEEIRLLQAAIARHEDRAFKTRAWLFSILGGLTIAVLAAKVDAVDYAILSALVVVACLIVELPHRVIMRFGIRRVGDVEEQMRLGKRYDGPLISESLGNGMRITDCWKECRILLTWLPYAAALLSVLLLAWCVWCGAITPQPNR